MNKFLLALSLLFLIIFNPYSQNRKIVDQKPYCFADSVIEKIERTIPETRKLISNVDFFKITYLSDGLKITGYMSFRL